MRIGLHVSVAGGFVEALRRAERLGCNAFQIFVSNPRSFHLSKVDDKAAAEFRRLREEKDIRPVAAHMPYIVNLSSFKEELYAKSIGLLRGNLEESEKLGLEYLVCHCGGHLGRGREYGIDRMASAINTAFKGYEGNTMLLVENTSGSGTMVGGDLKDLADIYERIEEKGRVGFCIDTCHAFVYGYDIRDEAGMERFADEIESCLGIERLRLIHVNDAKGELGSKTDRHEHLGKGNIGPGGFRALARNRRLSEKPMILETPEDSDGDDVRNLEFLRGVLK